MGAAKVVGARKGGASTDVRKCQLRGGGYAIQLGDDRIAVGPGDVMLDRDTARAHAHMLEHPDDPEFLEWLGVEFAKNPPPPNAQELLMQAQQLTERAQAMLRQQVAPAKKN